MTSLIAVLIFFGVAGILPLYWCGIVWLLSRVGGWHRLAERFAAGDRPPGGERHAWVTGRVGIMRYKSTLVVRLEDDGFFLETVPFFRFAHPRLFIPWSAIGKPEVKREFFREMLVCEVGHPPIGKLMLPADLVGRYLST